MIGDLRLGTQLVYNGPGFVFHSPCWAMHGRNPETIRKGEPCVLVGVNCYYNKDDGPHHWSYTVSFPRLKTYPEACGTDNPSWASHEVTVDEGRFAAEFLRVQKRLVPIGEGKAT